MAIEIELSIKELEKANKLAKAQTEKYGHDDGYFKLGREISSHEIGARGEIAVIKFFKEFFKLEEGKDIGLRRMGDQYDLYLKIGEKKHLIHVKTGEYVKYPSTDSPFGIHKAQKIEELKYPIVLVSFEKDKKNMCKIEGFLSAKKLGNCKIIKKGEFFPNRNYVSNTTNWLTYIRDYDCPFRLIVHLSEL